MMFLPILAFLGMLGLAAANKAKASPGTNAYAADPNKIAALLDKLDEALDAISMLLTPAQVTQLKSYMAPYKDAGQLPPLNAVCAMLTSVLTRDQISMVVTYVPEITTACQIQQSAQQKAAATQAVQQQQIDAARATRDATLNYAALNAPQPFVWLVKVLRWVQTAPTTFFKPNVQQRLIATLMAHSNTSSDELVQPQVLAAELKSMLEPAIYSQLLFDLPDFAAQLGVRAEQPINVDTAQEKLLQIANWIKMSGLAPEQDAMFQAFLAPYIATNTRPSDAVICQLIGKVLHPEQLQSLTKNVAGFEQACRIV